MIRNLKVLILAAMALGVFGIINAAGAQAAEEFHCNTEPCKFSLKRDGTSTTAHHVFVVKNSVGESISFTCESISGTGTNNSKNATSLTVTGIAYTNCKSVLGAATVDMNGCDYKFASAKGGTDEATVQIECPTGAKIAVTNQTCKVEVGPQGPLKGIGYHNLNASPSREVTVTAKVPGIVSTPSGECGFDLTKTPITSEYTTGNTIATAETDPGGVMADGWWE